jgi:hypothetical protein
MSDEIPDMSHFLELHHGFHLLSVSFIVFLTEESHEIFITSEQVTTKAITDKTGKESTTPNLIPLHEHFRNFVFLTRWDNNIRIRLSQVLVKRIKISIVSFYEVVSLRWKFNFIH